jgi:hypothetical protein
LAPVLLRQPATIAIAEPDMPLSVLFRTIDAFLAALVFVAFS